MNSLIDNLISGLSVALAFELWLLTALCVARVFQCRHEYLNWIFKKGSWEGQDRERQPILILVLGLSLAFFFFFLRMSRAAWAWWNELWKVTDFAYQDLAMLPIGVLGVTLVLWWAYTRVFGYDRGTKCWKWMLYCAAAIGLLATI